jgi:hypothetical protein
MSLNNPMCDKRSSESGYTYGATSTPSTSFSRHFLAIRCKPAVLIPGSEPFCTVPPLPRSYWQIIDGNYVAL